MCSKYHSFWSIRNKLSYIALPQRCWNPQIFHVSSNKSKSLCLIVGRKFSTTFCNTVKCHKAIMDAIMVSYPWTSCQILQAEQGSMDRTKFLAKLPNFPCYARIMAIIKWQTMLKQVCSSLNIMLNTTNDSINNI